MTLTQYIKENFNGVQVEFAKAQGVKRQQVTQWIAKGFIVDCGVLYSPRRELVLVAETTQIDLGAVEDVLNYIAKKKQQ